jgi:UDP-N-acetylmuramyl tripeptide synthase
LTSVHPMNILDSRRLTGPGLLLDGPGAVLDIRLEEPEREPAISAWRNAAARLLQAIGWGNEKLVSRAFSGGVSLALGAPMDGLYAATELNERAWAAAAAELEGRRAPDFRSDVASLLNEIANERNPDLVALCQAARSRGVTFLSGEDLVSVGSGSGAVVWPADALPDAAEVDWTAVHDVPTVLVTGSNGKTTVVRLLGAMVAAAGRVPGITSTDGVTVGPTLLEAGDFSGPSGARMVLRRREVETAILETARGGILRRGLPVERADVAVVTNIADDHLGEFGVVSLQDLAKTKLLVARPLGSTGTLVLNADDPLLTECSRSIPAPIIWFSLHSTSELVAQHIEKGGTAVVVDAGRIVLAQGDRRATLLQIADVPITFGGTAEHNVANALAAVAAAAGLGIGVLHMTAALRAFGQQLEDNPGRANFIELGGLRILVDFAHNPHGMSALVAVAETIPAQRRLLLVGQAGDRSDEAIRELARAAWKLRPDHVVVKEMETYLRGRAPGQVPALLADEFSRLGVSEEAISWAGPEIAGVRRALEWARPGDLLVLAVHEDRPAVLDLLDRLAASEWRAGDPLPS